MWTLQVTEPFSYETDAREALKTAAEQVGFLGGTYGEQADGYYVQVFFSADKPLPFPQDIQEPMDSLPDGAKHVFVPPILQWWYGFMEAN